MSYCLNLDCPSPPNPNDAKFCLSCGELLLLGHRFLALKLLGQGGFGRTFLGVDTTLPSRPPCVIKQCCPSLKNRQRSPKITELFRREIQHLKALGQHPQIPDYIDHFHQAETDYLVQMYVEGQTLEQHLQQRALFGEEQIHQLLTDLLPVVQYIHDRQVIHRDIKPANVIHRQVDNRLVLVDFGASKGFSGEGLVETGTVIGSAGYAAPEQVAGRATFASDIYSLGVTCLHLLTGISPLDLFSFGEGRWVWRDFLPQPLSDPMAAILDRMVERDLYYRHASAAHVLHELDPSYVVATEKQTEFFEPFHVQVSRLGWHCETTLCGHKGAITAIAMHPGGQYFASSSFDKVIQLWSLSSQQVVSTFLGHSEPVTSLTFSPDGRFLISGGVDDTIRLWDVARRELVRMICDPADSVMSLVVAVSPSGEAIASGSDDGSLRIWNLHTGKLLKHFQETRAVTSLQFTPDGTLLASSSSDNTVRLWNLSTGDLVHQLSGHRRDVNAFAITPNGKILVSASSDNTLRLWDLATYHSLKTLTGHLDWVKSVAIAPNGSILASGSSDTTIRLWQLPQGTLSSTLPGHTHEVNALAFTPDGRALISGGGDRTLKIWRNSHANAEEPH